MTSCKLFPRVCGKYHTNCSHRLYHIPSIANNAVAHYAEELGDVVALAEHNSTYSPLDSNAIQYFAARKSTLPQPPRSVRSGRGANEQMFMPSRWQRAARRASATLPVHTLTPSPLPQRPHLLRLPAPASHLLPTPRPPPRRPLLPPLPLRLRRRATIATRTLTARFTAARTRCEDILPRTNLTEYDEVRRIDGYRLLHTGLYNIFMHIPNPHATSHSQSETKVIPAGPCTTNNPTSTVSSSWPPLQSSSPAWLRAWRVAGPGSVAGLRRPRARSCDSPS